MAPWLAMKKCLASASGDELVREKSGDQSCSSWPALTHHRINVEKRSVQFHRIHKMQTPMLAYCEGCNDSL